MKRNRNVFLILLSVLLLASAPAFGDAGEAETLKCGDYEYRLLDDGTAVITSYRGSASDETVPETLDGTPVTAIGDAAYLYCMSLKSVTIPDTVVSVGCNPFDSCPKLETIRVSPDHPTLMVEEGSLISREDRKLVCYPKGRPGTEYSVPDGVAVIGERAFGFCKGLEGVAIPDSVEIIEEEAFASCSGLVSAEIPESVTAIGKYAFRSCDGLTAVTIPDSVRELGVNPFWGCSSLQSVEVSPDHPAFLSEGGVLFSREGRKLICYPRGLKAEEYAVPEGTGAIGESAFYGCSSLTSVTIPDSVTAIGDTAFNSCGGLTSVVIPDSVSAVGENPFEDCDSLASILVSPDHPYLEAADGILYSRADRRLVCCPVGLHLTSCDIAEGTEIIGKFAFHRCLDLSEVTLPDSVVSIGQAAFFGAALETLDIPEGVESIGVSAFYHCDKLKSVSIPGSVTAIGSSAFGSCPDVTLTVQKDSFAAGYCRDYGLRYSETGGNG